MANQIQVSIKSEAWVKESNSYMNIDAQFKTFFPDDCFIARGTGGENKNILADRGIDLEYEGVGATIRCFLELRDSGQFRPSNRGSIRSFYRATKAKSGDTIVFTQISPRKYKVTLTVANMTNASVSSD